MDLTMDRTGDPVRPPPSEPPPHQCSLPLSGGLNPLDMSLGGMSSFTSAFNTQPMNWSQIHAQVQQDQRRHEQLRTQLLQQPRVSKRQHSESSSNTCDADRWMGLTDDEDQVQSPSVVPPLVDGSDQPICKKSKTTSINCHQPDIHETSPERSFPLLNEVEPTMDELEEKRCEQSLALATPTSRCDLNSLSVILSFLNLPDFISALLVSHDWYNSGQTNMAWHCASIQAFIDHFLDTDGCSCTMPHRRFTANKENIQRLLTSPAYKKLNDIEVLSDRASEEKTELKILLQLTQLPHVTSVECSLIYPATDTLEQFTAIMKDRLQVLCLSYSMPGSDVIPSAYLAQFKHLRVLVIDFLPSLDPFFQLHELEFLCVKQGFCFSPDMIRVVRYLSTRHHLQGVTFTQSGDNLFAGEFQDLAFAALAVTPWSEICTERKYLAQLAPGESKGWRVLGAYQTADGATTKLNSNLPVHEALDVPPCGLTFLTISGRHLNHQQLELVLAMPLLERLNCYASENSFNDPTNFNAESIECLSRLTQLKLQLKGETDPAPADIASFAHGSMKSRVATPSFNPFTHGVLRLASLALCISLIKFKLDCEGGDPFTLTGVRSIDLMSWLPYLTHLEDLTLKGHKRVLDSSWTSLTHLTQLRRLSLQLRATPNLSLIAPRLGQLTKFTTLEVTIWPMEVSTPFPMMNNRPHSGMIGSVNSAHGMYFPMTVSIPTHASIFFSTAANWLNPNVSACTIPASLVSAVMQSTCWTALHLYTSQPSCEEETDQATEDEFDDIYAINSPAVGMNLPSKDSTKTNSTRSPLLHLQGSDSHLRSLNMSELLASPRVKHFRIHQHLCMKPSPLSNKPCIAKEQIQLYHVGIDPVDGLPSWLLC